MTEASKSRRVFSNRHVLLSASALVGSLAGYGRAAEAQVVTPICTSTDGTNFVCTGVSTSSQTINATNATVTTEAPLSVTVPSGPAITITGDGDISFTDPATSGTTLSAASKYAALNVESTGDSEGSGSVTIDTAATITSFNDGIQATNRSSGDMTVTTRGIVNANKYGLDIQNADGSGGLSLTVNGDVTGDRMGVAIDHYGSGPISITVNANITGVGGDGIDLDAYTDAGNGLTFYTAPDTTIRGSYTAVDLDWGGSGLADIDILGDIDGNFQLDRYGSGDTQITIAGDISGGLDVSAQNSLDIDVAESASAASLYASSGKYGDIDVNIDGTIDATEGKYGRPTAVQVRKFSDGAVNLTVGSTGSVQGGISNYDDDNDRQYDAGIAVASFTIDQSPVTITTEEGSSVSGRSGILASTSGIYGPDLEGPRALQVAAIDDYDSAGEHAVTITVGGDVVGERNDGIRVVNGKYGSSNVSSGNYGAKVEILSTGSVTSNGTDNTQFAGLVPYEYYNYSTEQYETGYRYERRVNQDRAIEIVGTSGEVIVAGTVKGGAGGAIVFDAAPTQDRRRVRPLIGPLAVEDPYELRSSFDDRLELQAGYSITGIVDAGGGSNTLALGGEGTESFDVSLVDADGSEDANDQYFGFNNFLKEDGSAFTLTGANTEIEAFAVNGGTLFVNGTMANAAFAVASGATIGGTGSTGAIDVSDGATLAPGIAGAIGTLSATDVTFGELSTFGVDILANGTSDLLDASGAVTIQGGTISISGPNVLYSSNTRWTIITADGGVTGQFSDIEDDVPDVEFYDIYDDANAVRLGIVQDDTDASDKANAPASASGAGFSAMNFAAVLSDFSLARNGSVGGTTTAALQNAIGKTRGSALAFAQDDVTGATPIGDSGLEASLVGLANFTKLKGDFGTTGYDADTYGGAALLGYRSVSDNGSFSVGAAGGYTESDVDTVAGSGKVEGIHAALYSGYRSGGLSLTSALSYGWLDVDLSREPMAGVTVNGETEGEVLAGFFEIGYDVLTGQSRSDLSATPFLRVRGFHSEIDGYSETGSPLLNLTVGDTEADVLFGGIGIRLAKTFTGTDGGFVARPHISVAFEHEFLDDDATSFSALTALPGSGFATPVGVGNEELFTVGTGLDLRLGGALTAGFNYEGSFGELLEEHRGSIGLKFSF